MSDWEREEVVRIRCEAAWPWHPLLPVKRGRPRTGIEVGLLLAPDLTTVVLMNMFELKRGVIGPQLEGKKRLQYESVEAMVADGWRGD